MMTPTSYTLLYGNNFENELDFSRYIPAGFNADIPERNMNSSNRLSNGSNISKENFYSGRKIMIPVAFYGFRLHDREALLKVVDNPYFIPQKLQRTQLINNIETIDVIRGQIKLNGGEPYKQGYFSSEIDIEFWTEEPYFVSETETIVTLTDTESGGTEEFTLTNEGLSVYPQIQFTIQQACEFIDLKLFEGYGFRLEKQFVVGDIVEIDMSKSNLDVYLNSGLVQNIVVTGSAPFQLLPGENRLFYSGGNAEIVITYFITRL